MKLKFDRMSLRYSTLLGRVVVGARVVAAGVLVVTASSALAAPAVPGSGTRPGLVNDPGDLRSVTCATPTDCWVVGDEAAPVMGQSLVLHFDVARWSPVAVSQPGGTGTGAFSELNSVRCVDAKDCWAVGSSKPPRQAENKLALHWNGRHWKLFAPPNPGGISSGSFSDLTDVSCPTAKDCWAVGDSGTINPVVTGPILKQVNEAWRWNGTKWRLVKVPDPAGKGMGEVNILNAVRCVSVRNCWTAGDFGPQNDASTALRNLMLHWNGTKWNTASVPNPGGAGTGGRQRAQVPGLHVR
jgi:hypothetical protein